MAKLNLTPDEVVRVLAHRAMAATAPDSLDLFRDGVPNVPYLTQRKTEIDKAQAQYEALLAPKTLISKNERDILDAYQQWLDVSEHKTCSWLLPANIVDSAAPYQAQKHPLEARLEQMQAAYNQFYVLLCGVNLLIDENKRAASRGEICNLCHDDQRHLYQIAMRSLPALQAQLSTVSAIYESTMNPDDGITPDEIAERPIGFYQTEEHNIPISLFQFSEEQLKLLSQIRLKVDKSCHLAEILTIVTKNDKNKVREAMYKTDLRKRQKKLNDAALCLAAVCKGIYAWTEHEHKETGYYGDFVQGISAIHKMARHWDGDRYNFPSPYLIEFV
jgi:hypothetical protein